MYHLQPSLRTNTTTTNNHPRDSSRTHSPTRTIDISTSTYTPTNTNSPRSHRPHCTTEFCTAGTITRKSIHARLRSNTRSSTTSNPTNSNPTHRQPPHPSKHPSHPRPIPSHPHKVPPPPPETLTNDSGLPLLAQLGRPSQIRLTSDHVIPVVTHDGQQALIVSPAGVQSLAQQGYRVEVRVFAHHQQQQLQGQGGGHHHQLHVVAQPQIPPPPPERRFGLTDLVTLFRRRLGQQLWLMCKLAFMVGIFSSNNASWRRILGLCIAAAGIFCNPHPPIHLYVVC